MQREPRHGNPTAPFIVCVHGIGSNGRYFDLSENSLAQEANERGMWVLLIYRLGHDYSLATDPWPAIDCGVSIIRDPLESAYKQNPHIAQRQMILIRHYFGGAFAYAYTASQSVGSAATVCISGIGGRAQLNYFAEIEHTVSSGKQQLFPKWFFGQGSAYNRYGVTASRLETDPPRANEAHEIAYSWPERSHDIAPKTSWHVNIRLAEYERIWAANALTLERIADQLTVAPHVDAAIAPEDGPLYTAHIRGPELIATQLDFASNHSKNELR